MKIIEIISKMPAKQKVIIEVSDKIIRGFTASECYDILKLNERYLKDFQKAQVINVSSSNNTTIKIEGILSEENKC